MKKLYFLICLFSGVTVALAQKPAVEPRQLLRLELPLETYTSSVQVQPLLEDSSLVLLIEKDPLLAGKPEFYFQKFDRDLKPVKKVDVPVPRSYELLEVCSEGTDVYALFQGTDQGTLWVAAFDSRTGELGTGEFETKRTRQVHDLKALDGNLFVTVEVDQHLTLLLLDLQKAEFRFLPSIYEPLPSRFTFLADSATKRAELILSESNGFKSRLQLKQLADDGSLLRSEFVQASSERGLLDAQLSPGDSAARLLAGTYTLRDSRYSQGLFASDLNAGVTATGQRRSLRYYDFLNLKHFFDFMKPARLARMRKKSAQLRASDRQYRHRYMLLMHDMMPTRDGYVLVSEVYYPRYSNTGFGNYGLPANSYYGYGGLNSLSRYYNTYNGRRSEGYRTTQALVCGFDRQGNLLWDNSFILKEMERFDLQENVRARPLADGRRIALAYLKKDEFHYKIIDRDVSSPNDWQVLLRTTMSDVKEKATETKQEELQTWYGSRFLAMGYQHVRIEKGEARDVFFINVLDFE
ncbi:hypothetical protein [Hymenobacter tenuis]